jgi:Tat protein secretion system quality control protein TatD with DNase activity
MRSGARTDTLRLMKEHVPKDWRVHVHCFTSSLDMAKSLLTDWPNLVIGYTGVRDANPVPRLHTPGRSDVCDNNR